MHVCSVADYHYTFFGTIGGYPSNTVRASNVSDALTPLEGPLTPLDGIIAKIPTQLPVTPETMPTVPLAPEQVKYVFEAPSKRDSWLGDCAFKKRLMARGMWLVDCY